eukprot:m.111825 g.111825  ORF g.111825 m.111825 type:complete len:421 (+) comp51836_c0_seq1:2-1264(+)
MALRAVVGSAVVVAVCAVQGSRMLLVCTCIAAAAAAVTASLIPLIAPMCAAVGLQGKDLNKVSKPPIPEALGVVPAAVYLVAIFSFIPFYFNEHFLPFGDDHQAAFPISKFVEFLSALLCICCMVFLGFADDVLNLPWRAKLVLPTIASLPLLIVYHLNHGSTTVLVPIQLRFILGTALHLSGLYYVFMGMLAVFCTNAINILAGINGVEAGQSFVIALSVLLHNFVQLDGPYSAMHELSIYLLLPFAGVTAALLYYNWFPSRVFVGDTFCYFAGMMFAVVAILCHFSKTVLLFMIPQVFNFVFSVPQLFKIVPCPRHRMPKLNAETGLLEMSYAPFKQEELSSLGRLVIFVARTLRLVHLDEANSQVSNFTIINMLLRWFGPMSEQRLCVYVLLVQVLGSAFAFGVRYKLAGVFYDVVE